MLKGNYSGEIITHERDAEGHYIILILSFSEKIICLINVYGYNSRPENMLLFDTIDERIEYWLNKYLNAYLLVGGDQNVAMDNNIDRHPPKNVNTANSYIKSFTE